MGRGHDFQKRRLACNESRLIFESCVTESVRSCFQKKSSHEKRFFGVVREGSVSVAEGDCCEFDSVLQFCTVQFVSAARGRQRSSCLLIKLDVAD